MQASRANQKMSLNSVDPDEKVLATVRRHPFGIIKLYFQVIIGLLGVAGLMFLVLPEAFPAEDYGQLYSGLSILAAVVIIVMIGIVGIATVVYNTSKLVITDKTITQTIQYGLFSRKTSQLAVTSVEDVTAHKNGFFPTIFNYGQLLVETAGEQENFHFEYCPQADHYAKLILETRQQFMGNREMELYETTKAHSNANTAARANSFVSPPTHRSRNSSKVRLGALAADGADDDQINQSVLRR